MMYRKNRMQYVTGAQLFRDCQLKVQSSHDNRINAATNFVRINRLKEYRIYIHLNAVTTTLYHGAHHSSHCLQVCLYQINEHNAIQPPLVI